MKRLIGKVAIVAGAGPGIGAATARRLAQEGAHVVLADINISAAEQMATELTKEGCEVAARPFDLMDEESIRALIGWTVERYGSLNILHNNAADTRVELVSGDMAIGDMTAETWDRTFQSNARGTMLLIKHALPAMLKAGGGSIINTGSGTSLMGDLIRPAYASSKAAINCLSLYVATQYGRHGIRCNVFSPGLIPTPTVQSVVGPDKIREISGHALLPTLGAAEDIAAAVAFLASDDARNITGHILPVDGGYSAHQPHFRDMLAAMAH